MSDFDFDLDPESVDLFKPERDEEMAELRAEAREGTEYVDPFEDWFMPGYVTEMDYMNAMEADDYRNELSDFDVDPLDFGEMDEF